MDVINAFVETNQAANISALKCIWNDLSDVVTDLDSITSQDDEVVIPRWKFNEMWDAMRMAINSYKMRSKESCLFRTRCKAFDFADEFYIDKLSKGKGCGFGDMVIDKPITSQDVNSAEEWLKKHHYVDSGIEWNPLPSTNEGMRVSISSVLDQFVSSLQSNEWVKVEDRLPENVKIEEEDPDSCKLILDTDDIVEGYYADNTWWIDLGGITVGHRNITTLDIEVKVLYWKRELPQPPK